jgi:hypothetical protein
MTSIQRSKALLNSVLLTMNNSLAEFVTYLLLRGIQVGMLVLAVAVFVDGLINL